MSSASPRRYIVPVPTSPSVGVLIVSTTADGIRWDLERPHASDDFSLDCPRPDVVEALTCQAIANTCMSATTNPCMLAKLGRTIDDFGARVLAVSRSPRWREALSHALAGGWSNPLMENGALPATALGTLKAEVRALHRQLVPVWRRRTRHGRVLSLDASLGESLSLHDLVAADVDDLGLPMGGVFDDERLNVLLRALQPAEREVVFAYAEGEGTTWTEAAAAAGAADPDAFGERVRRKAKRLAAEHKRRLAQRRKGLV